MGWDPVCYIGQIPGMRVRAFLLMMSFYHLLSGIRESACHGGRVIHGYNRDMQTYEMVTYFTSGPFPAAERTPVRRREPKGTHRDAGFPSSLWLLQSTLYPSLRNSSI